MPELSPLTWIVGIAALVIGILAGHFGWGRRWPQPLSKLHPDCLTGLDYLVTEQPDRALDMFLKLMEANPDTIETHFSLGSLYRRRGEVERAIRIHQNLLARERSAAAARQRARFAAQRLRAPTRVAAGIERLSTTGAHQGGAAASGLRALPVRAGRHCDGAGRCDDGSAPAARSAGRSLALPAGRGAALAYRRARWRRRPGGPIVADGASRGAETHAAR